MSEVRNCRQAGCNVRNDAQCLEGIDTADCPHFYWASEEDIEEEDTETLDIDQSSVLKVNKKKIQLYHGHELSLGEVATVTNKYLSSLVIILGDQDSGKTTLLSTIYDVFQIGQFKRYLFASSLTQKGFEIRSHLSRMVSGGNVSDTERTKVAEFRILHLGIRCKERNITKHFLLSDVSGETIKAARSSGSKMKEQLKIAKLADYLIYIVDGEKLSGEEKSTTILNTELFIQSAISNKIFDKSTDLKIVISKWDILKQNDAEHTLEILKERLNKKFSNVLGNIEYKILASRPSDNCDVFPLGFGVEDILDDLMNLKIVNSNVIQKDTTSGRLIDRFKMVE